MDQNQIKVMQNPYFRTTTKIPKSIKSFFLILHLIFGEDFGFSNMFKEKTAKFLKHYSVIISISAFTALVWPFQILKKEVWYWCTFTECFVNFCILKSAKYTVFNLVRDVHEFGVTTLEKETLGILTALYSLCMFVLKASSSMTKCSLIDSNVYCINFHPIYYTYYVICSLGVDLVPAAQIVISYYIYAFVKQMKYRLERDKNIKVFIKNYNLIADIYDEIKSLWDNITLMELFINIPKLMNTSFIMLDFINQKQKWHQCLVELLFAFHLATQIVIPSVIAQLIKYEMDGIKHLFNKWRMFEKDPEKTTEIVRVMKYLKVRRLENKIWGIIPTDLRLPLTLVSICTTYLIVIIQLTHLYD